MIRGMIELVALAAAQSAADAAGLVVGVIVAAAGLAAVVAWGQGNSDNRR